MRDFVTFCSADRLYDVHRTPYHFFELSVRYPRCEFRSSRFHGTLQTFKKSNVWSKAEAQFRLSKPDQIRW